MWSPEKIESLLREKGLRVTAPRLAVLQFVASTTAHPTADEVGAAVNRIVPTASRASVYNVLHSLTEAGLVRELVFDDAVVRYDANVASHHHFVCRVCRSVEDVPWEALPETPRPALGAGQVVDTYTVTLRGACGACAARGAASASNP